MNSICRFVPSRNFSDNIHIINYIYEADPLISAEPAISAVYRVHYVTEGEARVRLGNKEALVEKGDIFILLPGLEFTIHGNDGFRFLYISCIGARANYEIERLNISSSNFVFKNFPKLRELWKDGVNTNSQLVDLVSEGILLTTFAAIGNRNLPEKNHEGRSASLMNAVLVKEYIDRNFADPLLSLDTIGLEFSYSKKYISALFKRHFKTGIVEYIKTLRMNHACFLLESGYTNITEVAMKAGFEDALYFSKVFKAKMGVSPKQYSKSRK